MGFFDYKVRKQILEEQQKQFESEIRIGKKEDEFYALDSDVELTAEQKQAIDEFWGKWSFMGKIDYRAFKTFYNRNGFFDPRYVPHYFCKFYLRPNTAPEKYATAFQNKAYLPKLMPTVKQPETIVRRVENIYYNKDFRRITLDEAIDICLSVLESGREIVVKPSGKAGGKGVEFLAEADKAKMKKILRSKGPLFVVQKAIHQHPEMAALNSSTVNTVRLTTFMLKGEFIPVAALIKVGAPSVRVDNYKHGGCLLGVHMDGSVLPWALNIDRERITELPSGIKLGEGGFTRVPCFDSVLATAREAHYHIPKIKLISWDIAIDDENEAEIIEANFGGDLRMHQVLTGPVFGDRTEEIIDYYVYRKFYKTGITKDFDYKEYPDHIEITKYAGKKPVVSIPSQIAGKPVTVIGEGAFEYCRFLLKLTVPETVTTLRRHAFFACTNLYELNLNVDKLKSATEDCVNRCYKLEKEFKDSIRAKE